MRQTISAGRSTPARLKSLDAARRQPGNVVLFRGGYSMGQFLRLLLNRRRNDSRPRRLPPVAPRARPVLEGLESRTLLNNRFVVPVGTPIDNMATFATLQAALTTAGLSPGDIIQIEPGSAPGNVVNANMPTVANLTIQGDLAVSASALPQFTLSNAVTLVGTQIGFTLRNVNIGLVGAGSLTFSDNATITGSQIVDLNSSALLPLALNGTVDVLTNSTLVDNSSTAVTALLSVSPGVAGSSDLI